ncbi:MAG: MobF family relaxase [Gallionella sp.]
MMKATAIKGNGSSRNSKDFLKYLMHSEGTDYYQDKGGNGLQMSRFHGGGSLALGLDGTVKNEVLKNLALGFSPDGKPMCQNAGDIKRRMGYDLTFSAPKSVSILFAQSDEATRQKLLAAQQQAVAVAFQFIEKQAFARRGKTGSENAQEVDCKLIGMEINHFDNRNLDPQMHSHLFVPNLAVDENGNWSTFDNKVLMELQGPAGAIYRAELAKGLQQELNIGIEKQVYVDKKNQEKGIYFGIAGIDKSTEQLFSSRREEMLRHMAQHNVSANVAWAQTRKAKQDDLSYEELSSSWETMFSKLPDHPTLSQLQQQTDKTETISDEDLIAKLHKTESVFTRNALLERVANEYVGILDLKGIEAKVDTLLESEKIVQLRKDAKGNRQYTSQVMLDMEQSIIDRSKQRQEDITVRLTREQVDAAIASFEKQKNATMTQEQRLAMEWVCMHTGGTACLSGMAGTGKTFSSLAFIHAYQQQGYKAIGVAVASKAAKQLHQDTGIPCYNAMQLESMLNNNKIKIDPKTIIILDEAGMAGAQTISRLQKRCDAVGAKLVLMGDALQLQPVEASGAFSLAIQTVSDTKLSGIQRQNFIEDRVTASMFYGLNESVIRTFWEKTYERDSLMVMSQLPDTFTQADFEQQMKGIRGLSFKHALEYGKMEALGGEPVQYRSTQSNHFVEISLPTKKLDTSNEIDWMLADAVQHQDPAERMIMVERYVERNANVNACAKDGETILFKAVKTNDVKLVDYLLTHGADPRKPNADGKTITTLLQSQERETYTLHTTGMLEQDGFNPLFYADLKCKDGTMKRFTGNRLMKALEQSGAVLNDRIAVERIGMVKNKEDEFRYTYDVERVVDIKPEVQERVAKATEEFTALPEEPVSMRRVSCIEALNQEIEALDNQRIQEALTDMGAQGAYIFERMVQRNQAVQFEDDQSALEALLKDYFASEESIDEKLVIAGTQKQVGLLNDAIHQRLKSEGVLGAGHTLKMTQTDWTEVDTEFCVNDRIKFTEKDKFDPKTKAYLMNVANGDEGTITAIEPDEKGEYNITVQLTSEKEARTIQFNTAHYKDFKHNYAMTVHASQGQGKNAVFSLCSAGMTDRHLSLVAFTRMKKTFKLYGTEEDFELLGDKLERTQLKTNAVHLARSEEEKRLEKDLQLQQRMEFKQNVVALTKSAIETMKGGFMRMLGKQPSVVKLPTKKLDTHYEIDWMLARAVQHQDPAERMMMVERYVERNANVNACAKDGETILFKAVKTNDVELVDYLLKHGADPRKPNANGKTIATLFQSQEQEAYTLHTTGMLEKDGFNPLFYADLKCKDGTMKRFTGNRLKKALKQSGAVLNDRITVERKGLVKSKEDELRYEYDVERHVDIKSEVQERVAKATEELERKHTPLPEEPASMRPNRFAEVAQQRQQTQAVQHSEPIVQPTRQAEEEIQMSM